MEAPEVPTISNDEEHNNSSSFESNDEHEMNHHQEEMEILQRRLHPTTRDDFQVVLYSFYCLPFRATQ
jgi:hypothetical protein